MLKFHVSTSAAALAAMATLFAHPPVAWAVTPAAASEAVGAPASPARQLMMLRFALQEYSEGVAGGAPIDLHELATAQALVAEVRGQAPSGEIDRLAGLMASYASQAEVEKAFAVWWERYGRGLEPERPGLPPAVSEGRALFARYCVSCHGVDGDGRGPIADAVEGPPPADFTDPGFMNDETPAEFYQAITIGVPATAMPSWDGLLTAQERWDIVAYLWTLHRVGGQGPAGDCGSCHESGQGAAAFDKSDAEVLALLLGTGEHRRQAVTAARRIVARARDRIFVEVRPGTATGQEGSDGRHTLAALDLVVEEYGDAVEDGRVTDAVEYGEARLFVAALRRDVDLLAARGRLDASSAAAAVELESLLYAKAAPAELELVAAGLRKKLVLALGEPAADLGGLETTGALLDELAGELDSPVRARELLFEAYMAFETVEKRLAIRAPELASRIEKDFADLRALVGDGKATAVDIEAISGGLVEARSALRGEVSGLAPFLDSLVIILREGMEAILIISALAAYLARGGHAIARRWLYEGAVAGVVVSLITAVIVDRLLAGSALAAELIEGITMVAAAVVLFLVSYWLISKVEAHHWQVYIREQLDRALGRGSRMALGGVAFLAVYREGFETVLFYRALAAEVAGPAAIVAGFAVGLALLALVYLAIARFSVNIPLRPFFSVTGLFLYLMAFRFAGAGVGELQEAGVMGVTAVAWWPDLPALAMSADLETALAQASLLAAAAVAAVVILRGSLLARSTN